MTDSAPQLEMPSPLHLVRETVASFSTDKSKSSVATLDSQTLIDLGLILTDKDRDDADALIWLIEDLGDVPISRSAFYRFACEFKDRYKAIVKKYREQLAKLSIEHATDGKFENMAAVLKNQLARLMAQKVIDTDDLAELQGRELGAIIALLDGWGRGKFKSAELTIKQQKLESDMAKRDQEIEKLKFDLDERKRQLAAKVNEAKREIEGATDTTGKVTRQSVFDQLDKIMKGEA